MNSRRSFFKSLAMLGAAAVGAPGIFIPKFEPVKWKTLSPVNANFHEFDPRKYYGEWRSTQTTYRLIDEVWVPDDKVNFAPYPHNPALDGLTKHLHRNIFSDAITFKTMPTLV